MSRSSYPFAAIVGQDEMKLALVLTVINPAVSGVLIRGDKGTAKSTAVRGLAELLPERVEVGATPYHLSPAEYREYWEELGLPAQDDPGCRWWSCRSGRPRTGWRGHWTWRPP